MKIDKQLFDEIAEKAAASPRLRMHYDLRNDADEQSQRMLNVLLRRLRPDGSSDPRRTVPLARGPRRLASKGRRP